MDDDSDDPHFEDDDAPQPEVARIRRKVHSAGRDGRVRSKTIAPKRLTRDERRLSELLVYPTDVERPKCREECATMPRPCPFVSCSHHLYLDVNPETGAIKLNFPHLEVWEMPETCSLDVADRGGITLEEVGNPREEPIGYGLGFTAEGHAMTLDSKGRLATWDSSNGKPLGGPILPVHSIRSLSRDGRTAALDGDDQALQIWNLATEKKLAEIKDLKDVASLAFSAVHLNA